MSKNIELLCLANSDKNRNRCIAGLNVDTGDWVRPVSDSDDGSLQPRQYLTRECDDPNPLDVIELTLAEPDPEPYQPENWLIADSPPELRDDGVGDHESTVLFNNIHSEPHLFGDQRTRIEYSNIEQSPVNSSLEVISPDRPQVKTRERDNKKDQPRAVFEIQSTEYNLPITDPNWKQAIRSDNVLSGIDLEFEPMSAYIDEGERVLFTVSLSSPYDGVCYKLVAAIIPVSDTMVNHIDAGSTTHDQ